MQTVIRYMRPKRLNLYKLISELWNVFNINRRNKEIRMNVDFSQQFYYNDVRFAFLAKIIDWVGIWKALPGRDGLK